MAGTTTWASVQRLAVAVDDAPIVAYAFDQRGVITFVQGRGLELIGQAPDRLIGCSVFDVLASYPEVVSAAERALRGEEVHLQAEAFDRTWDIRSRRRWSEGAVEVVGVATDITEQASAQRALEASEALFRAVVENLSDVINVVRADGTVSLMGGAVAEVGGQTPRPLASGLDDVYEEDRPRMAAAMADLIARPGGTTRERFRFRHPDGTLHHLETTARNALDNPAVKGLIAVTRDITDLIQAQEELRANEERFRALVQQSSDVISVFAADGTRLYSSPAAGRLHGLPVEELPSNAMESMCEEDRDRVGAIFREIAEGRRVSAITRYRVRCSDGRLREVESTARSAIDDPAVGGIIVNTRDITEKARAEALLRAQAQMQAAVAAVGQAALAGRDIAELAQAACDAVGANLDAKYVLVLEPGAHSLVLRAGFGLPEDAVLGSELDAGETFSSRVMRSGEPLLIADMGTEPIFPESLVARVQSTGSLLVVPIEGGERPIGTITVISHAPNAYGADDVSFVQALANVVALAAERARVQGQLRLSVDELRKSGEDRQHLLAHVVQAQEEERRRIADDIHDDSVQVMTAVGLRLATLRRRLGEEAHDPLLVNLEHDVQQSITRLRHLMFELRPPALEDQGIAAALEALLAIVTEEAELSYSVEDRLSLRLNTESRIVVYRIAQEAVANVCKHAHASRIEVTLEESDNGVLVTIRDDGIGFEPKQPPQTQPWHMGLMVMRERAEQSGGWCVVESHPGRGTLIRYCVGCHPPESPSTPLLSIGPTPAHLPPEGERGGPETSRGLTSHSADRDAEKPSSWGAGGSALRTANQRRARSPAGVAVQQRPAGHGADRCPRPGRAHDRRAEGARRACGRDPRQ
jgi:PAS domain S-box-containing protein